MLYASCVSIVGFSKQKGAQPFSQTPQQTQITRLISFLTAQKKGQVLVLPGRGLAFLYQQRQAEIAIPVNEVTGQAADGEHRAFGRHGFAQGGFDPNGAVGVGYPVHADHQKADIVSVGDGAPDFVVLVVEAAACLREGV